MNTTCPYCILDSAGRHQYGCPYYVAAPLTPVVPDRWEPSNLPAKPYMAYGWVCPRCGAVNAPYRDKCDCAAGGKIVTTYKVEYTTSGANNLAG